MAQTSTPPERLGIATSAAALGAVLVRRRRGIVRTLLLVAIGVTALVLLRPRQYTSTLAFTASSKRSPSSLAGLASQFGFNVSVLSGEGGAQSQFYVDLLAADGFLREAIRQPIDSARRVGLRSAFIPDLLGVDDPDLARRLERTIPKLRSHVTVVSAVRTGVVNLSVTTTDPRLSYALARHLFAKLDAFNQELRSAQAASELHYSEARAAILERDLLDAESVLSAFLRQNRDFHNAPELQFRFESLQREVQLRSQVLGVVRQSIEQAKLDQQRDTPVLSELNEPIVPPVPDSRHLMTMLAAALLATVLVCIIAALPAAGSLIDSVSPAEFMERARRERADAVRQLRRNPFRLLIGSGDDAAPREGVA